MSRRLSHLDYSSEFSVMERQWNEGVKRPSQPSSLWGKATVSWSELEGFDSERLMLCQHHHPANVLRLEPKNQTDDRAVDY